jgi:hypothetical protein
MLSIRIACHSILEVTCYMHAIYLDSLSQHAAQHAIRCMQSRPASGRLRRRRRATNILYYVLFHNILYNVLFHNVLYYVLFHNLLYHVLFHNVLYCHASQRFM